MGVKNSILRKKKGGGRGDQWRRGGGIGRGTYLII